MYAVRFTAKSAILQQVINKRFTPYIPVGATLRNFKRNKAYYTKYSESVSVDGPWHFPYYVIYNVPFVSENL